ncbi:MAG TPA: protein kinase [Gaiellaceae bacterium]|nr:protein kinase [Gaiellaceae bacterium]
MSSVVGELIDGRYELEELTGTGGMSRVYRARDLQLNRRVAIKILHDQLSDDPEHLERFRREARAAARLSHPNIVTVIDRGESDGRQFIVFEHVEGENLKELVGRTGPLPVGKALDFGIEIARALGFAHTNGVVHRDVKPQNVLIREGAAKVADFGIARADDPALAGQTTTGTVLGTGDYISPEQARGEMATEQSDVYSLGALLYELLTGSVPYPSESAVAAATRHATDPVPDVLAARPDVPLRLAGAVQRAMAKDPHERFASMDDFLGELLACRSRQPVPEAAQTMIISEPVLPRSPARAAHRRRAPVWALLVLVGMLALAGAGAYYLVGRHHAGPGKSTPPAAASVVQLKAVAAYDPPPGDGHEGDSTIANATDGSAATSWETERYTTAAFGNLKQGVGLVLDAGKSVKLGSVTIQTPTPGFTAEIKAGDSASGPFPATVSSQQTVSARTTFSLTEQSPHRYYLIWITMLARFDTGDSSKPFAAKIGEVAAS